MAIFNSYVKLPEGSQFRESFNEAKVATFTKFDSL